jgi:perosamine synthetase
VPDSDDPAGARQRLRDGLLPAPEPPLSPCPDGPRQGGVYRVAETKLDGNERRYLNECLDSNWISSQGAFVERFEAAFAPQAGCAFAVACSSGTAALHLTLASLGIGPGDEVIVPTFAMIAVANSVRYTGATVALADVEPSYFNIDPGSVEAAITPRTRALIVVHTYGHPAQMGRLRDLAGMHRLHLIEDAAEAHGAELGGARVGGLGIAGTFSFYANKIITTGEGGMVTTNDAALATTMRRLRGHAFSSDVHFFHEHVGYNYRMSNLQAAVGLAQTERFPAAAAARRRLREAYEDRLRAIPGLSLPTEAAEARSAFWVYHVRVGRAFGCSRDALRDELARRGIETRTFFIPIHLQPPYSPRFYGRRFPVAENLCRDGLYLPSSEALGEHDIDWICAQIAGIRRDRTGAAGLPRGVGSR